MFTSGIVWRPKTGGELRLRLPAEDGATDATGRPLDLDCDDHPVTIESSGRDCDDTRDWFHRDAEEMCDGHDTNCDGLQSLAVACVGTTTTPICADPATNTGIALCNDRTGEQSACQSDPQCLCATDPSGCPRCIIDYTIATQTTVTPCQPAVSLIDATMCTELAPCTVEVLGVQYQQDNPYSEYNCYYHFGNYPTSCGTSITGCNAHVFLKNTGASAVTINDPRLAGYNLNTILKTFDFNGHFPSSIYLYWDDPPADVLNAGEPVWYRADPNPIPAGGTARVVVRVRKVPVTQPISLGVATSAGTVNTNVPVDANTPVLASVGFSTNRTKVYLHWRRNGGAAPASVWLDGTNVTSLTTTVSDPAMSFAVSVISLTNALPNMSYHVFQGVYSDGKMASGSLRVWVNRFLL